MLFRLEPNRLQRVLLVLELLVLWLLQRVRRGTSLLRQRRRGHERGVVVPPLLKRRRRRHGWLAVNVHPTPGRRGLTALVESRIALLRRHGCGLKRLVPLLKVRRRRHVQLFPGCTGRCGLAALVEIELEIGLLDMRAARSCWADGQAAQTPNKTSIQQQQQQRQHQQRQ